MKIRSKPDPWVLIIADQPTVQTEVLAVVAREGLGAVVASNSLEAKKALDQGGTPCIALLDAMIPGADELALMLTARKQCLVTTIPVRLTRSKGELVKWPVSLETIAEALRQHCIEGRAVARG